MNLAARQLQAEDRFIDFLIESTLREIFRAPRPSKQLGVPGSGSVGSNEQSGETLNGKGVDYTYNGITISPETKENGLDHNRIVLYHKRGKKKGQIKDEVSIGSNKLTNYETTPDHSFYMFDNYGDGAIAVWEFLAEHAQYEWGLTEYKLDGVVKSRIVSSAQPLSAGRVAGSEFSDKKIKGLTYWVSVHNHPRGGNGLSSAVNPGDSDDEGSLMKFQSIFPNAEMDAYDHSHLEDAKSFIQKYRK